jgi:hypothetical protein
VAMPEPKSLAARIASSRPIIGRAVPCRYWIMQVLCHVLCTGSGFGLEQTALLRLTFTCFHLLLRWDQLDSGIVIGAVRVLLSVELSGRSVPRDCDCAIEVDQFRAPCE